MATVIKQIGSCNICLGESSIDNQKLFIIGGFTVLMGLVLAAYPVFTLNVSWGWLFWLGLGVTAIGAIFGMGLFPKIYAYPAYCVYTYLGDTYIERLIKKTDDPEKDQTAICKATKELEDIIWEYENHQKNLERIAANCK